MVSPEERIGSSELPQDEAVRGITHEVEQGSMGLGLFTGVGQNRAVMRAEASEPIYYMCKTPLAKGESVLIPFRPKSLTPGRIQRESVQLVTVEAELQTLENAGVFGKVAELASLPPQDDSFESLYRELVVMAESQNRLKLRLREIRRAAQSGVVEWQVFKTEQGKANLYQIAREAAELMYPELTWYCDIHPSDFKHKPLPRQLTKGSAKPGHRYVVVPTPPYLTEIPSQSTRLLRAVQSSAENPIIPG